VLVISATLTNTNETHSIKREIQLSDELGHVKHRERNGISTSPAAGALTCSQRLPSLLGINQIPSNWPARTGAGVGDHTVASRFRGEISSSKVDPVHLQDWSSDWGRII